ncbi:uncharacterized protein LOC143033563 [Oratosquilla oratoria]|uniref:uncharacterized protein LOC143033563 n=1 Tax=Oratosquilla oratoria TaxID=337810 RepID=UPI003F76C7A1
MLLLLSGSFHLFILVLLGAVCHPTTTQFVPGFLVESGTDLQEWPQNLTALFPKDPSPEEQQDYYQNAVASIFGAGTVAAELPDHSPVEEVLGEVLPNSRDSPEDPGQQVVNGIVLPPLGISEQLTTPSITNANSTIDCRTVAFSVSRANYKHRKAGTKGVQLLFDKVLASVGPGYNHTGGYFHCQCPGFYFFSLHGISPLQGRARVDLMRNRQRIISSEAQYYGFGTAANSAALYVYKGDIIYAYLAEGYLYENDAKFRGYASLTGFKIG